MNLQPWISYPLITLAVLVSAWVFVALAWRFYTLAVIWRAYRYGGIRSVLLRADELIASRWPWWLR
jgi:hypothetical protein